MPIIAPVQVIKKIHFEKFNTSNHINTSQTFSIKKFFDVGMTLIKSMQRR